MKKILGQGMALLLLSSLAWGAQSYSLEDCYREALKRSETLASQVELVVQAEETLRQAWSSVLPNVSAYYQYFREDDSQLSGLGGTISPVNQQTLKISADQPLFRGFREYAALDAAKANIVYQKEARDWAGMQLLMDVSSAFNNVLAFEKDIQTLDVEMEQLNKRVSDLQQRARIGRSRNTEVLTAQASISALQAQKVMEQGQLDVAREILAFLTGLDAGIGLADSGDVSPTAQGLDSYLLHVAERPDVKAAQENVQIAKSGISIAKGAHLPNVDLTGNYYFERPGVLQNVAWDAEIVVTLPLFEGGLIVAQTHVAESQERQAELSLELVQRSATEAIRNDYHNVQSDLAQVQALEEAHDLAQKNYEAEAKDYNLGLISNVELLQALASAQDTQRALDRARFAAKNDLLHLQTDAALRLDLLKGN